MVAQLIDYTLTRFPRFSGTEVAVDPLDKGGSDRKFYRIRAGESSLILAKYGSEREENRHYVTIAQFLTRIGVRVPEIYFHDETEGLIWMEDLGDRDLWSYRGEGWAERRALYMDALEQVMILHTRGTLASEIDPPKFETEFNGALYRWEQGYFTEHCLGRYFGVDAAEIEKRCEVEKLRAIAEELGTLGRVLVHRDFQSQNIVIKDGEACLIDFQGMRPGLIQYDLASLLYDPYVQLSEPERRELLAGYLELWTAAGSVPRDDFDAVFDLCAMQRLMQALGAYGFLGLTRGRQEFLRHIPAALGSLRLVVGRIPGLEGVKALVDELAERRAVAA